MLQDCLKSLLLYGESQLLFRMWTVELPLLVSLLNYSGSTSTNFTMELSSATEMQVLLMLYVHRQLPGRVYENKPCAAL